VGAKVQMTHKWIVFKNDRILFEIRNFKVAKFLNHTPVMYLSWSVLTQLILTHLTHHHHYYCYAVIITMFPKDTAYLGTTKNTGND
jgi:hypothetical protein